MKDDCESCSPHPQHEYGQAQILLGLLRRPVNVFLYLGTGPGSLLAETWSKELTPPSYNRVSFGQGLGRAYTQCVQVDPLLASKTTGVDDALYFHYEQRTQVGVPRKNLSTEQRKNPALGLIRHWLRPVNNYKIITIQSQHLDTIKREWETNNKSHQVTIKGKVGWEWNNV
jgi:hypothetical protein